MKKIVTLSFLLSCILLVSAQDAKVKLWKAIAQQNKKDTTTLIALDSLAKFYGSIRSDTGVYYVQQMKILAQVIHNKKYERDAIRSLAQRYFVEGKIAQALRENYSALAISEELKNKDFISQDYISIGISYKEYGDFDKSISFFKRGYELADEINDDPRLESACLNLGGSYTQLNQLDSALYYEQRAYTMVVKKNDMILPVVETYLGDIQLKLGNYKLAEEYYSAALSKMLVGSGIQYGSRPIVWAFLGLSNSLQKLHSIDSSFKNVRKGLMYAQKMNYLKGIRDAQKIIAELYDTKHQIDSAYYYHKLYVASNDSLYNRDKTSALESLNFEKSLEEKQKQAEMEEQHQQRQHNIQLAILAIGILLAVIIFLLLSNSFMVSHKVVGFLSVLVLLVVFEFMNLLLHPFLESITHHNPVLMLLALVAIAALIIPLHHRLEHWTTQKLVEKNKAIRLANAKKTMEELENEE